MLAERQMTETNEQIVSRVMDITCKGSTKQLHSKDSKDKDDISWGTLTENAVYAVTRTINKFPIEVELKEYRFIIRGVGHQTTISHMFRHSYVKHYDAVIKYYEMGTKVQLGPEQESYGFIHACT
ncbi:uncharacterized protein LOC122575508 [Bombus pyrosoma]|uniref:uncharacterized protein LOC122575508 n=1 Tax=Bombus pyrosoma TaxID=396416 RepID=UPI001CB964FB|nr:uncharacterized protein LOC122575508 [Bombus pyrosoma]